MFEGFKESAIESGFTVRNIDHSAFVVECEMSESEKLNRWANRHLDPCGYYFVCLQNHCIVRQQPRTEYQKGF